MPKALLTYCLIYLIALTPFISSAQTGATNNLSSAQSAGQNVSLPNTDSLIADQRKKIRDTYEYLIENNRFTEFLDLTTVVDFPIGIKKTIGNNDYVIAIDSIVITPTYSYLNASMSFKPTGSTDWVAFRGTDIRFTRQGGLSGDARLELVGDFTINLPGDGMTLTLLDKNTFVEWDCDGFKQFNLEAALNFSREMILPIDDGGNVMEGEVAAKFSINLEDWNDLVASVNIQPFQITGTNGFNFYIEDAIFDFSDFRNPTSVTFPENYQSPYFLDGSETLWRGVYIRSVVVNLPSQFAREDGNKPQIQGVNLLIDQLGLTGELHGNHLLSLGEGGSGSMSGWPFSIDKVEMEFNAGKIVESNINGEIILPISDEKTTLKYDAFIDHQNNYFFNISPTDSMNFAMWKAGDVKLYESSYVNVEVVNGVFTPSAKLNGRMTIDVPIGNNENAKIADIEFEDLSLSSLSPFVYGGVFSNGSEESLPKLAAFDLDIEKIGISTNQDSTISLEIDAGIVLSGKNGGSFSASGGFSVISENVSANKRPKLVYKKTKVKNIKLNADNGAFSFAGELSFYESDPVFGNGFMGNLNASFSPGIELEAFARFGTINNMKYWHADALAKFNTPVTIGTGFGIYGLGGGAFYHMKQKVGEQNKANTTRRLSYLPDPDSGLGLRAAVSFGSVPTDAAYNGDASFEMAFYKSGGMKYINFKGEVAFMNPPLSNDLEKLQANMEKMSRFASNAEQPDDALKKEEKDPSSNGKIDGHININYDFSNRILHGNVEVFATVAKGIIKGAGSRNKAGWAVLHFAPEDWYVHIGTPSERIGLVMGVGKIAARADAYFMVGTNIPASPPPNENVSRILGGMNLNYMRDENALGLGAGFAMGAGLGFNTGNLKYWKFYAKFTAGAGFDLMLKNYGPDISCANRSGPIGINGWYANGQAYAFFDGKIGIRVDLFGDKQNIDIINLAAAAVLQAKLPNPVWMRGVVGGSFSALGGLVKGECKFEVVIGEECDIQGGSAVSGIEVIADITPAAEDKDVSVFNNPQAVFNMPIDKVFELVDIDNTRKAFRIKLDHFRVRDSQNTIMGEYEWNINHDVVILNSHEVLPPESEMKAEVQISFEKRNGGQWIPVTSNGNIVIEKRETSFTTGTAPDYIPLNNIDYSYPVVEMVNYYPSEQSKGYIQLKKGQAYLFEIDENWQQIGRMESAGGTTDYPITYKISSKSIDFNIPQLNTNKVYALKLVNTPKLGTSAIDRNVVGSSSASASGSSEIQVNKKQAVGSIDELKETLIFSTKFRTSKYETFEEKTSAIVLSNTFRIMVKAWDLHLIKSTMIMNEYFDYTELSGNEFTSFKPMLTMEAMLDNNGYYQNKIQPLIYNNYPIDGIAIIEERDITKLGLPPSRAVTIGYSEAETAIDFSNASTTISNGSSYLIYDLPRYYRQDFFDIRNKVIPLYIFLPSPLPSQVNALLFHSFPFVNEGKYKVQLNYTLPGATKPNSSYVIEQVLDFSQ